MDDIAPSEPAPSQSSGSKPAVIASPPANDEAQLPTRNHGLLIIGIMAASLLQILDTTIANVAIPHMQSALGATRESVTWVLTSYIIASAVAIPLTGWLADRIGARFLFIASVAAFIITSMLCGIAQNLEEMVAFRAMQGIAGAFIAPLSQSFLLDTSKPSQHPQMMAIWGMGIMVGPILGPILGGWLTETANWRWVFYVNLPVGILALAILMAYLPHRTGKVRRFDIAGFILLAVSLTSLQLMLDRGPQLDWLDSAEIWAYLLVSASTGWIAMVHFATAEMPMFERRLFKDRNFVIALLFMILIGVVMFATMALLPPMLQNLFGYGVIDTGIVLMPRGVGILLSMQIAGQIVRRGLDVRPTVGFGFLICAFSLWQMSHWSLEVDSFHIILSGLIQGLGLGLIFIPMNVSAFATLPMNLRTEAASLMNLLRSIGASAGISLTTALLAHNIQTSHGDLTASIAVPSAGSIDISMIDQYQAVGDIGYRLLDAEINRQAAMVAYIDNFWLMMWITLAAAPLVMVMKKSK